MSDNGDVVVSGHEINQLWDFIDVYWSTPIEQRSTGPAPKSREIDPDIWATWRYRMLHDRRAFDDARTADDE